MSVPVNFSGFARRGKIPDIIAIHDVGPSRLKPARHQETKDDGKNSVLHKRVTTSRGKGLVVLSFFTMFASRISCAAGP